MHRPATAPSSPAARPVLVSQRDAHFYSRPNSNLPKVYHLYHHGTSGCGRSVLDPTGTIDVTAADNLDATVPADERCRRNGCAQIWPDRHAVAPHPTLGSRKTDEGITPRLLDLLFEDWTLLAQMRESSRTIYPDNRLGYYGRASMLRLVRAGLVTFDPTTCWYAPHTDIDPYMQGRDAALGEQPASTNPYDRQRQRFQHHAWNNGHAQRAHTRALA